VEARVRPRSISGALLRKSKFDPPNQLRRYIYIPASFARSFCKSRFEDPVPHTPKAGEFRHVESSDLKATCQWVQKLEHRATTAEKIKKEHNRCDD
jgi:hypothetical protein